jgi:hypothetical protein
MGTKDRDKGKQGTQGKQGKKQNSLSDEGRQDSISCIVEAEFQRLEGLRNLYEKECRRLPEANIIRKTNKGRQYYYVVETVRDPRTPDHKAKRLHALGESNRQLREDLWRRRCLKDTLPIIKHNLIVVDRFLKRYKPTSTWPAIRDLPPDPPLQRQGYRQIQSWDRQPFESNPHHLEGLIHMTQSGRKVRSKSEAIIAGLLEMYGVPFRYEARLNLIDRHLYPDFTIKRKQDGRVYYWEHFGMIEDEVYLEMMNAKMTAYREAGILPWNQLITTFDSENGSIDVRHIEGLVRAFFL